MKKKILSSLSEKFFIKRLINPLWIWLLPFLGFLLVLFHPLISRGNSLNKIHLSIVANNANLAEPILYSDFPIVFVSRQIPEKGSIYWDEPKGMAGVGPWSRFQVAAPGKLLILYPNGSTKVLIDGSNPTISSLYLIDVNAPAVSYDGKKIVFAGIPKGDYETEPLKNPGAWRIYTINADGTNLQRVTRSDLDYKQLDMSQFGPAESVFDGYDDTDPVWLPDGRIVFSSTRWPSIAQYSGVRTTNLYVVNANGNNLHRITAERNGADRPLVDPVTGKIVYFRWWRNHRFAVNSMETIPHPDGGYIQKDGLTIERDHVGRYMNLWLNFWQISSINPDGTELEMWSGAFRNERFNHAYGGAFTPDGRLITNYFPMSNMTEAAGFGGLRSYERGPYQYQGITGITDFSSDYVNKNPNSYGIYNGSYAAEPDVFENGNLVISWAPDIYQDYGIYLTEPNGGARTLIYDNPNTAELQAQIIQPRSLPPIIPDQISESASLLPPPANGPYNQDGTFVFQVLNIYANGPVDSPIVNAPAVGSAYTLRFFADTQRTNRGSAPNLDWPILLDEILINSDGSVTNLNAPANIPLFEQVRSVDGTVPLTYGPSTPDNIDGAAHVAGMNFGRPGTVQTCVGCHAGHSMIPVPENQEEALWTNLAPGAEIKVSSTRDPKLNFGLIDRQVLNGDTWQYWSSASGESENQWIELIFPVPIIVRNVRLYNPRQGGKADSTIAVHETTVILFSDESRAVEVARDKTGSLSVAGTDVVFDNVSTRVVRIEINSVSGTFYNKVAASLAEIEIIAKVDTN